MAIQVLYTIGSVLLVSLVSLLGVVSLLLSKERLGKLLLTLVSLSAGTLLGGAFLHLLPKAVEKSGFSSTVSLLALLGILVFFVVERYIHFRQYCEAPHAHKYPLLHEPHKHHIGILNLLGDGVHNFIDGLIIAVSYLTSVPLGIATTIAVIVHEVPQELADFGVLLYAGYSKGKALLFNFLSAAVAIVGAIVGLLLGSASEQFSLLLLPFAAGGFLYIASSTLLPELHKECGKKEAILHGVALIAGIALMYALRFLE